MSIPILIRPPPLRSFTSKRKQLTMRRWIAQRETERLNEEKSSESEREHDEEIRVEPIQDSHRISHDSLHCETRIPRLKEDLTFIPGTSGSYTCILNTYKAATSTRKREWVSRKLLMMGRADESAEYSVNKRGYSNFNKILPKPSDRHEAVRTTERACIHPARRDATAGKQFHIILVPLIV